LFRMSSARPQPSASLFPYTTLFRSRPWRVDAKVASHAFWMRCLPHVGGIASRAGFRAIHERGARGWSQRGLVDDVDSRDLRRRLDRKSTRLNSSHSQTAYAVLCLKT